MTFLRSKSWVAVAIDEKLQFLRPIDCWASRTRRGRPPRFIGRISDSTSDLVQGSEELAALVFGDELGLQ